MRKLGFLLLLVACAAPRPLRVMTLNLAHGRGEAVHQALLPSQRIEGNLAAVAELLRREQPHVVALQEADGPSAWSGNFDHVARLGDLAGYPHRFRGDHARLETANGPLVYGTALLARQRLAAPASIGFGPAPATPPKGFVVATLARDGVDVVSVHFDFLLAATRRAQAARLVAELRARDRPLIVLGDFNCAWESREDTLRRVARDLDLRPAHAEEATFPFRDARLDWILISPELEFAAYRVVPDAVSDHRAVVADVRFRP